MIGNKTHLLTVFGTNTCKYCLENYMKWTFQFRWSVKEVTKTLDRYTPPCLLIDLRPMSSSAEIIANNERNAYLLRMGTDATVLNRFFLSYIPLPSHIFLFRFVYSSFLYPFISNLAYNTRNPNKATSIHKRQYTYHE